MLQPISMAHGTTHYLKLHDEENPGKIRLVISTLRLMRALRLVQDVVHTVKYVINLK